MFASASNTLCDEFFSRYPCQECTGVDAMAITDFHPQKIYFCFPPLSLKKVCIRHIIPRLSKFVFLLQCMNDHDTAVSDLDRLSEYRVTLGESGRPGILRPSFRKDAGENQGYYRHYLECERTYLYFKVIMMFILIFLLFLYTHK